MSSITPEESFRISTHLPKYTSKIATLKNNDEVQELHKLIAEASKIQSEIASRLSRLCVENNQLEEAGRLLSNSSASTRANKRAIVEFAQSVGLKPNCLSS